MEIPQDQSYTCCHSHSLAYCLMLVFHEQALIHVCIVHRETQVCAPYNGTTCRAYLQGRLVMHHPTETLQHRDAGLEAQLQEIEDLGLFAENMGGDLCEDPARRLLCHMAFPDCHNETHQAVPICQ